MKQNHKNDKHEFWGLTVAYLGGMAVVVVLMAASAILHTDLDPNTSDAAGTVRYLGPRIPSYCVGPDAWMYKECAQYNVVIPAPSTGTGSTTDVQPGTTITPPYETKPFMAR